MGTSDAKTRPLSPKMARFAVEYAASGDALRAALAAGFAPSTARTKSWDWLRVPAVQQAIQGARVASKGRVAAVEPGYVISRLKAIVESRSSSTAERLNALGKLTKYVASGAPEHVPPRNLVPVKAKRPKRVDEDSDDDGLSLALAWGRDRPH